MRKAPPPIRMISRQEIPVPNSVTTGSLRRISQVRLASSAIRNTKASDSPIWRARKASLGSQREVSTEMKTRLSMPSTISSTVKVTSAAQAFGSNSRFTGIAHLVGQPNAKDIDTDDDEPPCDPWSRRQVTHDCDERERRPGDHGGESQFPPAPHPHRMNEFEPRESQYREDDHSDKGAPGRRPQHEQVERHQVPE